GCMKDEIEAWLNTDGTHYHDWIPYDTIQISNADAPCPQHLTTINPSKPVYITGNGNCTFVMAGDPINEPIVDDYETVIQDDSVGDGTGHMWLVSCVPNGHIDISGLKFEDGGHSGGLGTQGIFRFGCTLSGPSFTTTMRLHDNVFDNLQGTQVLADGAIG